MLLACVGKTYDWLAETPMGRLHLAMSVINCSDTKLNMNSAFLMTLELGWA